VNLEDIPVGEGRALAVDGEQVAVFRLRDGSLRALAAVCPHKGGPLADGLLDQRMVVCPLHGYSYDLQTGAELSNDGAPVCTYTVTLGPDQEIVVEPRVLSRIRSENGV
jgi:nitrite reductase (NADH) small subunit